MLRWGDTVQDSFLKEFNWHNWDTCALQCHWIMTWGNGLEEHGVIESWKMSLCAWQSFGTSSSVAVRGEPGINEKSASWPFMCLYATISSLFMTAKTWSLSPCEIYACLYVGIYAFKWGEEKKKKAGVTKLKKTQSQQKWSQASIHTAVHGTSQSATVHTWYTLLQCIWNEKS